MAGARWGVEEGDVLMFPVSASTYVLAMGSMNGCFAPSSLDGIANP
jgi:hypothetical protein